MPAPRRGGRAPLARLVAGYLTRDGFEATAVGNGLSAVDAARPVDPDVVVLDPGPAGLDGLAVCRALREFSDCYVLMLTARSEESDTPCGLAAGADDYLTKPFSPRELVARVHVLLRRPRTPRPAPAGAEPPRLLGLLSVDVPGPRGAPRRAAGEPDAHRVRRARRAVGTAGAGAQPDRADRRRVGENWVGDEHLVDVHIGHLRRKLGDDATAPRYVRTVRGVGYRMGDGG